MKAQITDSGNMGDAMQKGMTFVSVFNTSKEQIDPILNIFI